MHRTSLQSRNHRCHSWSWCKPEHNRDKESIPHLWPQNLPDNVSRCLVLRSVLLWDIMQHRMAIPYCFEMTYWSHLQGPRNPRISWFLNTWRWGWQIVLKRWYGITTLCCVISQNREDLIYIAADAWNHKLKVMVHTSCTATSSEILMTVCCQQEGLGTYRRSKWWCVINMWY